MRDGKPFDNDVVGHYVYRVSWSPDGKELLFTRTNRRQNILEFAAAQPDTGACRVIVREEWPTGWVETSPTQVFLKDGRRFIWASERNGWRNFYLYDLSGKLITPLTRYTTFEAANLVKVDEDAKVVFLHGARRRQLPEAAAAPRRARRQGRRAAHRSGVQPRVGGCMPGGGGRGGGRREARAAGACGISPDNKYVVDVYQTHDTPPATRLVDAGVGQGRGGAGGERPRRSSTSSA